MELPRYPIVEKKDLNEPLSRVCQMIIDREERFHRGEATGLHTTKTLTEEYERIRMNTRAKKTHRWKTASRQYICRLVDRLIRMELVAVEKRKVGRSTVRHYRRKRYNETRASRAIVARNPKAVGRNGGEP